jgi:hypothetical protein
VHVVTSFPHPAKVNNEDNETFATKRVLPVPLDSSAQAKEPTAITDNLRQDAVTKLRKIKAERPQTFAEAARTLRDEKPGLEAALRAANMTTTAFLDMFSDLISRKARTISAIT